MLEVMIAYPIASAFVIAGCAIAFIFATNRVDT